MRDVCLFLVRFRPQISRSVLGAAALFASAVLRGADASPPLTAPVTATHPLDPLTEGEFATLKEILAKQGSLGARATYSWVELQEPPKEEVLAFAAGRAFSRKARVVALVPEKKTAFELLVDLHTNKVESMKDLQGLQPSLTTSEFDRAKEVVDGSAEVRAALAKRGYAIKGKISDALFVDTYAPGEDPACLDKAGRPIRAIRVLFADRQGGLNDYGPYVEGLMVLVDVYGDKILAIQDTPGPKASRPVPHDVFNRAILGAEREPAPAAPPAASLPELKLEGNHVRWRDWDLRFSFNQREGLVLHQIRFNDAGRARSVCYRAAVSEMLVPYADPAKGWVWREFFDQGEYGMGVLSIGYRPGKELPANTLLLDAVLPTESLERDPEYPGRVFFYERDGGLLFAHHQESDGSRLYGRSKELVTGYVIALGNYEYVFKWIFRVDGSFGFEAELQGLILNKTIADEKCEICAAGTERGPGTYDASAEQRFGTVVTPQMLGVTHQHWINLRLDFDVDGTANAVEECNTRILPADPEKNPAGRALTFSRTIFGTEREAVRTLNGPTNRSWVVFNPEITSALGHHPGYEIAPGPNSVSMIPEQRFGEKTSFTQRHFWVTRYHPEERYAAGRYPNQAGTDYKDDLANYAKDESIYKEDAVIWYTMGFTHITRPEDYPVMAAGHVSVNFTPWGFFEKAAATGYAHIELGKKDDAAK